MALETMTKLASVTVGSGGSATIDFTKIPQDYTDLKILVSSRDNRSGQPNGDLGVYVGHNGTLTTATQLQRRLYGTGGATGSDSNASAVNVGMSTSSTATGSVFGISELYFSNYSGNNYKGVVVDGVSENNGTTSFQVVNAGLFQTSLPITDIRLTPFFGTLFDQHTTATLYGIKSAAKTAGNSIKANGGDTIRFDGTYWYHVFTSTGTFVPFTPTTAETIVVAGGGGAIAMGGGAGAGGLVYGKVNLAVASYAVTVGGGGTGSDYAVANSGGSDSSFAALRAFGGGAGKGPQGVNGNGGSGGGGGFGDNSIGTSTSGVVVGSVGTAYGNNGGLGSDSPVRVTGGGGGAGGVGATYSGNVSGNGGIGSSLFTQWGAATNTGQNSSGTYYYAGGGGGGGDQQAGAGTPGTGGLGGGGNGSINSSTAQAGTTNTGGGGGGGGRINGTTYTGGNGGSGIVIIRYKG